MADLAYFLMPNYWPSSLRIHNSMGSLKGVEGVPTPEDLISIYCRCRGIPSSLPQLNFYLALSVFKMAGIAQGIYAYHLLGNASAPNAAQFGQSVEPLAQVGLQIAERYVGSHDTKTTPYHRLIVLLKYFLGVSVLSFTIYIYLYFYFYFTTFLMTIMYFLLHTFSLTPKSTRYILNA
ncbi:hypothetical protein J4Q44_G00299610 [Coregonus suidteri]|uniref:Uncharacterized protein n=1 Tax=Coregonus suidteri TaxID=861788 RepID=A0AAN8QJR2_9TELE